MPDPKKPRNADKHPGILKHWEDRLRETRAARDKINALREEGKGASLKGSAGTFWGALNAILEFVDHHKDVNGSRVAYALLGDGMDLKMRAFAMIQAEFAQAA